MLEKDADTTKHRCGDKQGNDASGSDSALDDGPDPDQQGRVSKDVNHICVKHSKTEEPPVLPEQLTAVGKGSETQEYRVVTDRTARDFHGESDGNDDEERCGARILAHESLQTSQT